MKAMKKTFALVAALTAASAVFGAQRTSVRDDGTLLINNRPWFPIGVADAEAARSPALSRCGFNAVFRSPADIGDDGYGVPVGLDMAVGYGQRCFFAPPDGDAAARDFLARYRTELRQHPAIALWDVTADADGDAASHLREADEDHLLYAEFPSPEAFRADSRKIAVPAFQCGADDSLAFCKRLKTELPPETAALCIFPAKPGRPVRDVRFDAYIALIHGARGLIWRPEKGSSFRVERDAACTNVAREAKTMVPGLVSKERRIFTEGDLLGLVCGTASRQRYLILVNVSDKRFEANLVVPELEKVAKVVLPFVSEEELKADVPVIREDELEKQAIFGDEMGIEVPELEDDLLVATDAEIKAIAAARKQARQNPTAQPQPAITLKARATGARGEVIVEEAPPETELEIFCGRVRHVFPPHGTLVYRW